MPRRALLPLLMVMVVVAGGCGSSSSSPAGHAATSATPAPPLQAANGPVGKPQRLSHSRAPVPVLMYHVIAPALPGATYAGLWVSPAALRAQVGWAGKDTLPPHPIVLSFDDGYLSQGQEAGAILRAQGWPGVLNLALHNLDAPGGLSASRVRTMIHDGWEIDVHSLTHPDLTTLDAVALRREVAESRTAIQERFYVPVNAFCYPAGRYDATVEAAVRAAGYRAATTVEDGVASPSADRYALPRIRVDRDDGAAAVVPKVRAALGSAS